jgi:hypothetical protein
MSAHLFIVIPKSATPPVVIPSAARNLLLRAAPNMGASLPAALARGGIIALLPLACGKGTTSVVPPMAYSCNPGGRYAARNTHYN